MSARDRHKKHSKNKSVKENGGSFNANSDVDDVVVEPETDSDMLRGGSGIDSESEIKKLRKKLKDAEQKAKEHLDGWQRLKADVANSRRLESERLSVARLRGQEEILESILPALDSFDVAMSGEGWNNVDDAWRTGMEFVRTQLAQALESHGIVAFGREGDTFDASKHEAAEGKGDKIVKVLRKGYMLKGKVIRPARVIVGN